MFHLPALGSTEISFIMRSRFGEVCSCCSCTVLPGPAWVLRNHFLRRIKETSVQTLKPANHPCKNYNTNATTCQFEPHRAFFGDLGVAFSFCPIQLAFSRPSHTFSPIRNAAEKWDFAQPLNQQKDSHHFFIWACQTPLSSTVSLSQVQD